MAQEGDQAGAWHQDMHDDHIVTGVGDDDFTKFLDLDGNDFSQFSNMAQTSSGLDTPMGRLAFGSGTSMNFSGQDQMDMSMASSNNTMGYRHSMHSSAAYSQYQQYPQMQMQPHYHVPPTPVSAEMQAGKYVHQMGNNGQILFDQQQVCLPSEISFKQTVLIFIGFVHTVGFSSPNSHGRWIRHVRLWTRRRFLQPIDIACD